MYKRNKFNYQFRLRCVEAAMQGNLSVSEIAREKGFEESNLRLWMGFYEKYGKAGLRARSKQHYDAAFKLQVLQIIDKECLSLRSACVRFNIPSDSLIIKWRQRYELEGRSGLIPKPKGRPPKLKQPIKRKQRKSSKPLTKEEQLLQENEILRAENAYLKKLQALVQADKKQKP